MLAPQTHFLRGSWPGIFALSLLPGSLKMRFRILINRSLCTVFNMHSSYFAQPRPKKSWLPSFARVFRRLGTLLASDHSPAQRFRSLRCACRKDSRWSSWEVTWTSNSFKMLFSFGNIHFLWWYSFDTLGNMWMGLRKPISWVPRNMIHLHFSLIFSGNTKISPNSSALQAYLLPQTSSILGYGTTAVAPLINKLFSQCFRILYVSCGTQKPGQFFTLLLTNII